MTRVVIAIPARWGSVRFPGKPLAMIGPMTLLHRTITVAQRAAAARADTDVVVLTDDDRIARHATSVGCNAVMTAADISTGTARVLYAMQRRAMVPDVAINLQGDNPFVTEAMITGLIEAVLAGAEVATPVVRLDWDRLDELRRQKSRSPFSGTTCLRDEAGQAIWFSKQIVPAIRDEKRLRRECPYSPVFRHVGLYGYTLAALEWFERQPPTRYEILEGLEQLRFLQMGASITTITVRPSPISMSGIDTLEDLKIAVALIEKFGDPHCQ